MKKKILAVLLIGGLVGGSLAGCGNKDAAQADAPATDVEEEADAEAGEEAGQLPDSAESSDVKIEEPKLEIVYSDDSIDLAQYKGVQAAAYVNDVDDDYVNEYINSTLMYTYGSDEEGNPNYTVDTMTDEVAAELMDGSGTAEDYKGVVKAMLEEESKRFYDENLTETLFNQVVESSDVKEMDQTDVDRYVEYLNGYYQAYAESVGMELLDFAASSLGCENEEALNEYIKEEAEDNVKTEQIIRTICEQEGYTPTEEDKEAMVQKFVEMGYADTAEAVKEDLSDDEININTMYYKVLDIIKENADVK